MFLEDRFLAKIKVKLEALKVPLLHMSCMSSVKYFTFTACTRRGTQVVRLRCGTLPPLQDLQPQNMTSPTCILAGAYGRQAE